MNLTFLKRDWRSCAIQCALWHVACRILVTGICIVVARQALAYCDKWHRLETLTRKFAIRAVLRILPILLILHSTA